MAVDATEVRSAVETHRVRLVVLSSVGQPERETEYRKFFALSRVRTGDCARRSQLCDLCTTLPAIS